jgi:hypothetical protein
MIEFGFGGDEDEKLDQASCNDTILYFDINDVLGRSKDGCCYDHWNKRNLSIRSSYNRAECDST